MLWEDLTIEQQEAYLAGELDIDVEDDTCPVLIHWPSYLHPEPPEYCPADKMPGYDTCAKHADDWI